MILFNSCPALRRAGLLAFSLTLLALGACKKDKDETVVPDPTSQPFTLEFEHHRSDGAPLKYGLADTTALGAAYRVDSLKYYVSNVSFRRVTTGADSVWTAPAAYYLIRATSAPADNVQIKIPGVPLGTYSSVTFSIGIDNARNHSGDQTGVLNPKYQMLWTWLSGYKFFTLDGHYLPTGLPTGTEPPLLEYHLGGDGLFPKMTLTLPFPQNATVTTRIAPEAHIAANVNQLFDGFDLRDPGQQHVMMPPLNGRAADNLSAGMFEVEHVHNDPN